MDDSTPTPTADPAGAALAAELGAANHQLRTIERHVREPELEDQQTFAIPAAAVGPYVFDPAVPATAELIEVSAWQSGPAAEAIAVVDGSEGNAATELADNVQAGYVPILMGVPAAGVATIRRRGYSGKLTLFALQAPTHTILVTIRVRAYLRPEGAEHR